jgi:hypothetical protein
MTASQPRVIDDFADLLLRMLRHDAFTMEATNYLDPWFSLDGFRRTYDAYQDRISRLFKNECFCAVTLEVMTSSERKGKSENDHSALLYTFPSRDTVAVNEDDLVKASSSVDSCVDWLWEQAAALDADHDLSRCIREWRKGHQVPRLFFAPYIVQRYDGPWVRDGSLNDVETFYSKALDDVRTRFLYTEPVEIKSEAVLQSFPDAYFKAAWLVGIDDDHTHSDKEIYQVLESLSIMFQLSWGYPQLLEYKESMAKQEAERKQKDLFHRKLEEVSEIAVRIASGLHPLSNLAQQLTHKLEPPPSALLNIYSKAGAYIPSKDETFFGKWQFHHNWQLGNMKDEGANFRAQCSCILLAYLGQLKVQSPNDPWPDDHPLPWHLLRDIRSELDTFTVIRPTIDKLMQQEGDNWSQEDVDSYKILKGCFHYPFKEQHKGSLTGPLLLLWALKRRAIISQEDLTFLCKPRSLGGVGWPDRNLLVGVHGIYLEASESYSSPEETPTFGLEVSRSSRSSDSLIQVLFSDLSEGLVVHMEKLLRVRTSDTTSDEVKGSLAHSVAVIRELDLSINCDIAARSIVVQFVVPG